jgi:O-antigen ligase
LTVRFTDIRDLENVSAIVLLITVFLAPLWWVRIASTPGPIVTLGRVEILLVGVLLAAQFVLVRPVIVPWQASVLALLAIGLGIWIVVNAYVWGCRCMPDADGYTELIIVLLYCLIASSNYPELREPLIVAAGLGSLLASILALSGVHGLSSGAHDVSATGGRLSGTYGNANYLGFAASAAVPVLLAYLPGWTRRELPSRRRIGLGFPWLAGLAVAVSALIATYSRSALIAAFVGALVAASLGCGTRRNGVIVLLLGTVSAAAVVILFYPTLEHERQKVSLRKPTLGPNLYLDVGGWDGRAQGLIPQGSTTLNNQSHGRVLVVTPSRPGGGVSFEWGEALARRRYELTFEARAMSERVRLAAGMEDNLAGNSPSVKIVGHPLSQSWRVVRVSWVPSADSPSARLYIWEPHAQSLFALRRVRVQSEAFPNGGVREIPIKLRGPLYHVQLGEYRTAELNARASRLTAVHLALDALISSPVQGIGWEKFPEYAERHAKFGRLATHNDYLRVAAELGILGLLLFLALAGTVAVAAIQSAREYAANRAAIGLLATAAVGLAFLNGIVTPNASIPFAVAAAVVCSRGPRRGVLDPATRSFEARALRRPTPAEGNDPRKEVGEVVEEIH